ncbi:MAG: GspH/FimT family pseudopilin [Deltaproteobacteria bacterium]|nr:GspH/FimT family pseudopilin [Deltaproteobacteria bacterium]
MRKRGFTLIELLVVLSLVAILASISVVSHGHMRPALDLYAAARQVLIDLKTVRTRAIGDTANHRILFAAGSNQYRLQRRGDTQYDDVGEPIALPKGVVVVDCSATDGSITFRPRGNASSFGTITLAGTDGQIRRVVVDMVGHMRVQ